ncbi:MAG: hypothetical protein ACRDGU_08375 [Actinomycetota bacterium]
MEQPPPTAPARALTAFQSFAGTAAIAVGIGGLVYAILFAYIVAGAPRWIHELWFLSLMLGAAMSTLVIVAVYLLLRSADEGFALWALLLGLAGTLGGILHGASNLLRILRPPNGFALTFDIVVTLDPFGVLRYGMAGMSLLVVAFLVLRGGRFPNGLGYLAYVGGALLVFIFFGRLGDFITPDNRVSLIPPLLFGFVVYPAFYVWLGLELRRGPRGS